MFDTLLILVTRTCRCLHFCIFTFNLLPPPCHIQKNWFQLGLCLFRGRIVSKVSQSVSVLDSSTKDTAAKPPRRFSIPAKSNVSPHMKPAGNITPISETRAKRSVTNQGKIATPVSDVSKSGNRRNSSYISSATYWLSQIKLSESAAMHSISLGFFKLALEAGCKVYSFRHPNQSLVKFNYWNLFQEASLFPFIWTPCFELASNHSFQIGK